MAKQIDILCSEVTLYNAWNIVKEKGSAGGMRLTKLVVRREDWVNIYPLCTECYARIEYIPPVKKKEPIKIAVVQEHYHAFFDLLIQFQRKNHLRKLRYLEKPDFEGFDENAIKQNTVIFSQMKKKSKKLATFAKNE